MIVCMADELLTRMMMFFTEMEIEQETRAVYI